MSYQEFVPLFSNTYWVHMLGFVIVLFAIYKGILYFLQTGPHSINTNITTTDIVLQIVCGHTSVYVELLSIDGTPELITVRSNSTLTGLQVTGYVQPKVNYMWPPAIFVHDLTELTTVLAPCARITLYQAFLLRNILTKEYLTFIYLLHNNTIQPVLPSRINPNSTAFLYATAPADIGSVPVVQETIYPPHTVA